MPRRLEIDQDERLIPLRSGPSHRDRPAWGLGDVHVVMAALAGTRQVFHSEADFQHAFAWKLQTAHAAAQVRLETRPSRSVRLDLLAVVEGSRVAIEFTYLLRRFAAEVDHERFELPDHAARDVSRYDIVKDISRLEALVPVVADIGFAVVLTNDPNYWERSRRDDVVDAAFHVYEGRELSGSLAWHARAGAGTTRSRETALALRGVYVANWRDFSRIEGSGHGHFRYLAVEVV
jgi:hypothetical protein